MESRHRSCTSYFGPVVDKCTIAFRDEEDAFDVFLGVSREVVFQIADDGS